MPFQHSPPAKNTISQSHQAVLTHTERAPIYHTPSVCQLSASLERCEPMEGDAPSGRGGGEESVEQEDLKKPEVAASFEVAPEASEAPNIALSNQPLVSQPEPNFLEMIEQMTQFMGKFTKAVSFGDNSRLHQ
ncbi:hypothetical protein O181_007064 [Austropuccinia psidii MF-1]|uniref:Uncharacterized protein n=1 Tax=Austropuccinia psidii MF-1 TaxID=1389203 RepID=A0A9Q3GHH7_9BASI|nr:hypothetical protein [Austropuccinia psidii MF-1]